MLKIFLFTCFNSNSVAIISPARFQPMFVVKFSDKLSSLISKNVLTASLRYCHDISISKYSMTSMSAIIRASFQNCNVPKSYQNLFDCTMLNRRSNVKMLRIVLTMFIITIGTIYNSTSKLLLLIT